MLQDKEILYNMISRQIDNFIMKINPALSFLSTPAKNYIFKFIEPYIDAFTVNDKIDVDMAASFVQEEFSDKIKKFKDTYKEKGDTNNG